MTFDFNGSIGSGSSVGGFSDNSYLSASSYSSHTKAASEATSISSAFRATAIVPGRGETVPLRTKPRELLQMEIADDKRWQADLSTRHPYLLKLRHAAEFGERWNNAVSQDARGNMRNLIETLEDFREESDQPDPMQMLFVTERGKILLQYTSKGITLIHSIDVDNHTMVEQHYASIGEDLVLAILELLHEPSISQAYWHQCRDTAVEEVDGAPGFERDVVVEIVDEPIYQTIDNLGIEAGVSGITCVNERGPSKDKTTDVALELPEQCAPQKPPRAKHRDMHKALVCCGTNNPIYQSIVNTKSSEGPAVTADDHQLASRRKDTEGELDTLHASTANKNQLEGGDGTGLLKSIKKRRLLPSLPSVEAHAENGDLPIALHQCVRPATALSSNDTNGATSLPNVTVATKEKGINENGDSVVSKVSAPELVSKPGLLKRGLRQVKQYIERFKRRKTYKLQAG